MCYHGCQSTNQEPMPVSNLPVILDAMPHLPTDESRALVEQLAAFGHNFDEIAVMLKLNPHDVRYHYRYEVETGLMRCNAKVAGAVLRNAVAGSFPDARFWLINRAGWFGGSDKNPAKSPEKEDELRVAVEDKRDLMDRIVSMLSPEQVSDLVKAEVAGQGSSATAKSTPSPRPPPSNSRH